MEEFAWIGPGRKPEGRGGSLNGSEGRMRYVGNAARLAVLLFLTTGGRELFAQGAPVTTWRDLEYARAEGVSLTLDVYVPSGSGPFPLIVWIHGGGWISGDKALAAQSAQVRQTARGYVVASINYRLSGQAKFPAQSHDCKAAIRWLRANATLYKIDPARIGVWGGSAGGHLVALLGTSGGVPELEGDLGNGSASSRVQAVVDWYGPSDLLTIDAQAPPCSVIDGSSPSAPHNQLIGCMVAACPDKARAASPVTYASADDPPFLIMHGSNDCTVPVKQSEELQTVLAAAGVASTLHVIQGAGHGGPAFTNAENLARVEAFLDASLKSSSESVLYLPAIARTPGLGNAYWTTDLWLANEGSSESRANLKFTGHEEDGTKGPETSYTIAPGEVVAIRDVVRAVSGLDSGYGGLRIVASGGDIRGQSLTSTPAEHGTYGQAVPVFTAAEAFTAERPGRFLGVREDSGARSNLILMNGQEDPATVKVTLFDSRGSRVAEKEYSLKPLGMLQVTRVVRELGESRDVDGARLTVTPVGGDARVFGYVALIDNDTNDPKTLLPR